MRCPDCEAEAFTSFRADLAAHPEAGFVLAAVRQEATPGFVVVKSADVSCTALALVAVADALLTQAAERATEHADHPETERFLAAITTVRDALAASPQPARH